MSQEIGKLSVLLEAQTAEFTKGMDGAIKQITKMEQAVNANGKTMQTISGQFKSASDSIALMGRALAVIGGLGYVKGLMDAADAAADIGDAFGVAVSNVYAYQTALLAAGGKSEGFEKILQKVATRVEDAFDGADTARQGFEKLGISLTSIRSAGIDEVFDKIAIQLAAIEDPARRNAVAVELLGQSALGVDWKKYAEGIAATKEEYEKLNGPITRAADASESFELFTKKVGTVTTAILGNLPNLFREIGQGFTDMWDIITGQRSYDETQYDEFVRKMDEDFQRAKKSAVELNREIKAVKGDPFTAWTEGLKKSTVEAELFTRKMEYLDKALRQAKTSEEIIIIQQEMEKLNGRNPFEEWKDSVDRSLVSYSMLADQLEYLNTLKETGFITLEEYNKEVKKLGENTDELKEMYKSFQVALSGFGQTFSSEVIDRLKEGKLTFKGFLEDLTTMIAKFMMNQMVQRFLKSFMDYGGSLFPSGPTQLGGPGYNGRSAGGESGGQTGGVSRLQVMSSAYSMPSLPTLSTSSSSKGIGVPTTTVIVNNNASGVEATPVETTNSDGSRVIEITVERMMKDKFSSGSMDKTMKSSYGLSRIGV
jgi:DNA-binding HxlR family transcriptional regulator